MLVKLGHSHTFSVSDIVMLIDNDYSGDSGEFCHEVVVYVRGGLCESIFYKGITGYAD